MAGTGPNPIPAEAARKALNPDQERTAHAREAGVEQAQLDKMNFGSWSDPSCTARHLKSVSRHDSGTSSIGSFAAERGPGSLLRSYPGPTVASAVAGQFHDPQRAV